MENLKSEIKGLEADIKKLEEKIKTKKTKKNTTSARIQARIFLENIFAPYMTGICKAWGVSPEEGLRILIKENASLDRIAQDNPEALKELLNQPEIKAIASIASPLKDVTDEWLNEKMDVLFEVMVELRPDLAAVIAETPEGKEWYYVSMKGLRDLLFGVPKLNSVTK